MPWQPGDPWPSGTLGGASSPKWGGYVRLWVRAALAAGATWTLGPHAQDRLDGGNVLGGAPIIPTRNEPRAAPQPSLWVDLSCDVLDVDVQGGATSSAGIFTKPDAATCVVTLLDPARKYDPLNIESPYALGGRSRLVPGTPVDVFAEVVNGDDGTWSRHWIFTGTADSWGEDWTPQPSRRQAKLVATDDTKVFVNMNRPEQPAAGAGDTTAQRVQRIVTESGWAGTIVPGVGTVTLDATTLADPGWEMLNRTLDDELGFIHFTSDGKLRWLGRQTWFTLDPPVLELGCGVGLHDVLVDASPSAIEAQIRNSIYAARTGGTQQAAISNASISRYGRYDYGRTDLGLQTDAQAATWAQVVLQLYAYPQISLADVTMHPAIDARSFELWRKIFETDFLSDLVHIVWTPPDRPDDAPIDALSRVVGVKHTITRHVWEVKWQTIDARALAYSGAIFTLGPHANDRLDRGFVLG